MVYTQTTTHMRSDTLESSRPSLDSESRSHGPTGGSIPLHLSPQDSESLDLLLTDPCLSDAPPIQLEKRGVTPQTDNPKQTEFWRATTAQRESIVAKLREAGIDGIAEKMGNCGRWGSVAECRGCGVAKAFRNRCDLLVCPSCQPKIARDRRDQISWWTKQIEQPKHIVLTLRNRAEISGDFVAFVLGSFTRLRRRKFATNWLGGCWSLEVTNEGRGWHVHLHILVDAPWVDSKKLSHHWNSCTAGEGYIVSVKDCRRTDYLQEVTKYAVKGSQLAAWPSADVAAFVLALNGRRTFGIFGSLYGQRAEFTAAVAELVEERNTCGCGCSRWRIWSEEEWEAQSTYVSTTPTQPVPPPQLDFGAPLPCHRRDAFTAGL